ncbi:hypothetical protein DSO57_1030073 [Entomophthora muscae]|uniref:Uncharacterized protein n=1 Tax=Entomophthora muscae TaxID=34485 RepID=A0ACC2RRX3_9FUNG|nr:hypothetical protein DSO57_1030073 [Entomophthora muscae]
MVDAKGLDLSKVETKPIFGVELVEPLRCGFDILYYSITFLQKAGLLHGNEKLVHPDSSSGSGPAMMGSAGFNPLARVEPGLPGQPLGGPG